MVRPYHVPLIVLLSPPAASFQLYLHGQRHTAFRMKASESTDENPTASVLNSLAAEQQRVVVDRSTLTLLEHVNLNIPSHEPSLEFYFHLLGCGLDPRKADNLLPGASKKTLWANCGASQFHLPPGEVAQVVPGMIGLRYDSLNGIKERLSSAKEEVVQSSEQIVDSSGHEALKIVDVYGNSFFCRSGGNPVSDLSLQQPFIKSSDIDKWEWIAEKFGRDSMDCRGIDFVEFLCPTGTSDKIALFYETVLDATVSVVEQKGAKIAIIAFGNVDASGKSDQALLFRETAERIPPYDGHHVALYVGQSSEDFEQAFENCELANVIWVNPRFDDKAFNLQGAKRWKQFRFKNIVDMATGDTIFELEHEIRSVDHAAWPRRS